MSKRTSERSVTPELIDSDFERALEENEQRRRDQGRRVEQKTQQLCKQVQRALNLAVVGQFAGGALGDMFVVEVSAPTGGGRLVAHVAVPVGQSVSATLRELRQHAPQLRAIVAAYISRKRAPELAFVAAPLEGDACG